MEEKVAEHKSTIDYNEPRDFIDKVKCIQNRNIKFYSLTSKASLMWSRVFLEVFCFGI
jgi:hypothetical protein